MRTLKFTGLAVIAALVVVAIGLIRDPNAINKAIYSQAMPTDFFAPYEARISPALYQVSGPVYAFERGFCRSLVIDTGAGLAVIDTFDNAHAAALKETLATKFPNQPVRWVIFSHNHLDHIRGSATFGEAEIVGHENVNMLVVDWPDAGQDIATVTRPIAGDEILKLGNVEIEALYMPFSHSYTLYGFYVRNHDVVFAADMMFVDAVPPFDFPDFYYPGYVRALDRLIALNAAHYVPSHMDRGTRTDLIAYRDMTVAFQETVKRNLLAHGAEAATDGFAARAVLRKSYDELKPQYGHLHGFDSMFVPKFARHFGGAFLGY